MAKETKNLKLHQVTRPEDESMAFNLETMLNENWEKLDSAVGNLSQPVTTADGAAIGLRVQNGRLQYKKDNKWDEIELGLEYNDVLNLSINNVGRVTWIIPVGADQSRANICLFLSKKDLTHLNYEFCLKDAMSLKETLSKDATAYDYPSLDPSTQYWCKAFVKYTIGGKAYYSEGNTVTMITADIPKHTYYWDGNEMISMSGGWETVGDDGYSEGQFNKGLDCLKILLPANKKHGIVNLKPIDFTKLNLIHFEMEVNDGVQAVAYVYSGKNYKTQQIASATMVDQNQATGRRKYTISVGNIVGDGYIHLYFNTINKSTNPTINIYRIYGEEIIKTANELYFYGDQCADATGGWEIGYKNTNYGIEFKDQRIRIQGEQGRIASIVTSKKINIQDLYYMQYWILKSTNQSRVRISLLNTKNENPFANPVAFQEIVGANAYSMLGNTFYISNYNAEYYVAISVEFGKNTPIPSGQIDKVDLYKINFAKTGKSKAALYWNGDFCEDSGETGGWEKKYCSNISNLQLTDTAMVIYADRIAGTIQGTLSTINKIDFKDRDKITLAATYFYPIKDQGKAFIRLVEDPNLTTGGGVAMQQWIAPNVTSQGFTISIDTSALTGRYYVQVGLMAENKEISTNTPYLYIQNVY